MHGGSVSAIISARALTEWESPAVKSTCGEIAAIAKRYSDAIRPDAQSIQRCGTGKAAISQLPARVPEQAQLQSLLATIVFPAAENAETRLVLYEEIQAPRLAV